MNTDNQQETGTVSDADLGWIAGIIDGEGSVTMLISSRAAKEGRSQSLRIQARVIVGNTDPWIIEKYIAILDRMGVGRYVKHERPKPVSINGWSAYKAVTTVYVEGPKRIRKFLSSVVSFMTGEKKQKALALLKFINGRLELAAAEGKGANLAYTQTDVDNILAFLRLTKTKQLDHATRLLNEHTREARQDHRKALKRQYYQAAAERGYVRPSRCALPSRETVRAT